MVARERGGADCQFGGLHRLNFKWPTHDGVTAQAKRAHLSETGSREAVIEHATHS
jgi:hypothetical protein